MAIKSCCKLSLRKTAEWNELKTTRSAWEGNPTAYLQCGEVYGILADMIVVQRSNKVVYRDAHEEKGGREMRLERTRKVAERLERVMRGQTEARRTEEDCGQGRLQMSTAAQDARPGSGSPTDAHRSDVLPLSFFFSSLRREALSHSVLTQYSILNN